MSLVELGKQLLEAAKQGLTDEVRTLMSNGAPFTTDWLGTSPLHFAAQNGRAETVEVLLRAGLSRDARTKVDRTPLHFAAQEGHLQIVQLLIANGADIDAKDMLKMTPLHWAVEKGHADVVQLLVANGATVHGQNKFEKTPLDIAISNGRADLMELLQYANQNIMEINADNTVVEEVTTTESMNPLGIITQFSNEDLMADGSGDFSSYTLPVSLSNVKGIKLVKCEPGSTSDVPETNSTAVLATLAALAEARSSNNTDKTTTADALNWLETHGITMVSSGDNSSIVTSTLDGGQMFVLTEAGKLALKTAQEQGLECSANNERNKHTKVITLVSDVVGPSPSVSSKAGKLIIKSESHSSGEGPDSDELRRQLKEVQRQADEYKKQLKRKEQEAEVYKKKLTQISVSKLL